MINYTAMINYTLEINIWNYFANAHKYLEVHES